ncbi:MAG: thioredoxin domain-containing protein [Proteobacteria bacterium]|nr:thioredoxin domain-containing protein [Pseudomonadota bacterium]
MFEEEPWRYEGFDPADPGAGPAPLCPPGSKAINNSESPSMGGDVYPDLTVEVFSYFRCQNCAGLAELMHETWERRSNFQDTVRVFFHHFPLYTHKTAMELHASTVAAQEQGMANFWAMHDKLFDGLRTTPAALYTPEDMYEYARDTLHLNMAQYAKSINDDTMQRILWDKEQGESLDVMGTPGVFICGEKLMGWKKNLENVIDDYISR